LNTIEEFMDSLEKSIEELFGETHIKSGVIRSLPGNLGVTAANVIFEAAMEEGFNPENPYPVLHFHVTLAKDIEDSIVSKVLEGLNELNTTISAGSFPGFGCFGYYPPLRQVYLSYRMPINPDALDKDFDNVLYYLGTLYEQLDIFVDFVLFLCDDPEKISLKDYMNYLDSIADLNNMEERINELEKRFEELEKETKDV